MLKNRYLTPFIQADLKKKMVFIGGPRQVGKTSIAEQVLSLPEYERGILLNWDNDSDRSAILSREFSHDAPLIVFDEIHKNRQWRQFIKGLFDKHRKTLRILVTGSARLDWYRFGGDSLQGRYFYHRLHPFSVAELGIETKQDFSSLLTLSGFPEPFFSGDLQEKNRWALSYRSRLVREELRDFERVVELTKLELLAQRLPDLVGSQLSINGLREDLQVAHATINSWLELFERLYYIFRIYLFGAPKLRAIKKTARVFFYDWSLVQNEGARLENLVASHLLKWCHFKEDTEGRELELRYFRDIDQREVDFVVLERDQPSMFIEVKTEHKASGKGLRYLKERFPSVRAIQLALTTNEVVLTPDGIEKIPLIEFLRGLV